MVRRGWLGAGIALTFALTAGNAAAAIITVTTTADGFAGPGQCTLRDAIYDVDYPGTSAGGANGNCAPAAFGANTIVLGPHVYRLDQGCSQHSPSCDLFIGTMTGELTIAGAGEGRTSIDATGQGDRIFTISSGTTVSIDDLTLTGGHARTGAFGPPNQTAEAGADGGAVLNLGSLTLNDVAVGANQAGDGGLGGDGGGGPFSPVGGSGGHGGAGGAIYNTGNLTLNGVTVSSNHAGAGGMGGHGASAGSGGGPGADGGHGGAGGDGGGIASAGGTLTIVGSTIFGNVAGSGANGGAGGNGANPGSGGNGGSGGAGGGGGGISVTGGTLSVTNSTFVSNLAGLAGAGGPGGSGAGAGGAGGNGGSGGSGGNGGAIDVDGPGVTAALLQATVATNDAGASGPGPAVGPSPPNGGAGGAGSPTGSPGADGASGIGGGVFSLGRASNLRNSLLSSNLRGNCSGSVLDGGHNLAFNGSGCPVTFAGGDPKLGQPQDNGGPAATLSLGAGSAAIDQVPARGAGCPATDERGVRRPGGPACDIGAYEVAAPVVNAVTATATGPRTVKILVTVTANAARGTAWVRYGRTKSYGRETRVTNASGVSPATVSIVIRRVDLRRTYHYRVVVSSMDGSTQTGDITLAMPILRRLKLTPAKFGAGGTTLTYTDSRQALTTFTVQRRVRGRWVTIGSFRHRDRRGRNRMHWNGRLHGRKLRPGIYRLEASSRSGRSTGLTLRVRFTIVP